MRENLFLLLIFIGLSFLPVSTLAKTNNDNIAILNITAEKNTFTIGEVFSADVKVETKNIAANAVQAAIYFPKDIIEAVSYDKTASVINLWLEEPSFSNEIGKVTFIGGTTTGFTGKDNQILKINFKIKSSGTGQIGFTDGSVISNDSSGSNILSEMNGFEIISNPVKKIIGIKMASSTEKNLAVLSNKLDFKKNKPPLISALNTNIDPDLISKDKSFLTFSIKLTKSRLMGVLLIIALILGFFIGQIFHKIKIKMK